MCLTPRSEYKKMPKYLPPPPPTPKNKSQVSSLHLRLSMSPTQEELEPEPDIQQEQPSFLPHTTSPISMAGGDTILSARAPSYAPNISSRTTTGPIDNSVGGAALRTWEPNTTSKVREVWGGLGSSASEVAEGRRQEQRRSGSSSSGEGAMENFLTELKTTTKKPESSGPDPDFIVADEDASDSDELSSPRLSLRDKLLQKSQQNLKKPLRKSPKKSYKISSSSEDDSLPDPDSPVAEKKPREKGTKKKAMVIESSDSEDEVKPPRRDKALVISSDSDPEDDKFVNIYSPKYYGQVPPPDPGTYPPPKATPKTKSKPITKVKGVKGSKISPKTSNFKTPSRPPPCSRPPDTPTLTFLSSLTLDTPLHRCHPEAVRYTQKTFPKTRAELARRLHELYNRSRSAQNISY